MTLVASDDLLAPTGELEPALFPLEQPQALADRLDAYLTTGYARATDAGFIDPARRNKIATAYAYARAYDAALQRILANPTTSNFVDKGGSSYSSEQLRLLAAKVSRWSGEYDVLVTPDVVVEPSAAYGSGSTPNTFRW